MSANVMSSSMQTARPVLVLLWVLVPPMFLSALVHMADPDVDGWGGLVSSTVIWSVVLGGVLAAGCVSCCIVIFVSFGRWAFLIAAGIFSLVSGLALAAVGSGATTTVGVLWTVVGSTTLVSLVVFVAALPAVVLTWRRAISRQDGGFPDTSRLELEGRQ